MVDEPQREAPPPLPQKTEGVGPTMGIVIILGIIILGGIYYFSQGTGTVTPENETGTTTSEAN